MQLSSNLTISQFLNYNNFYKTSFQVSKCFFRFKALKDAFENCSCLGPQRNPISALSDSCPYALEVFLMHSFPLNLLRSYCAKIHKLIYPQLEVNLFANKLTYRVFVYKSSPSSTLPLVIPEQISII